MIGQITGNWGRTHPSWPPEFCSAQQHYGAGFLDGQFWDRPPHHRIPSNPWETLNSLESLRAHGVCQEHRAVAWGGESSGRMCFCHVTFVVCWLLGAEPVDFWVCSEMRARVLCSALLLFSLPASRQLCPPLSFLGASPPSVHWNRALQDPSGTTHPIICTQPCRTQPVFLGADPSVPSQYFKIICHA